MPVINSSVQKSAGTNLKSKTKKSNALHAERYLSKSETQSTAISADLNTHITKGKRSVTLEEVLVKNGADILSYERVFVLDPQSGAQYIQEFWRILDDPIYEDIRKRQAVQISDRLFYLLKENSQKKHRI